MDLLSCTSATHTKRKGKKTKSCEGLFSMASSSFFFISRSKTKISAPCTLFVTVFSPAQQLQEEQVVRWFYLNEKLSKKMFLYFSETLCYLENGSRSVNLVRQCKVWYIIRLLYMAVCWNFTGFPPTVLYTQWQ